MVAKTAKPRKAKKKSTAAEKITRFCMEYVKDSNGQRSAVAAGYSKNGARVRAVELLRKPEVQQQLEILRGEVAAKAGIDAQTVLNDLWAIHKADPRDLVDIRRECCRYCYGNGNRYQRTPREMEEHRKAFDQNIAAKAKLAKRTIEEMGEEFDPEGGIGWNPGRDPNKKCPECFGRGQLNVYPKDVRHIKPEALVLFGGVKQTQHGIEIKTRDQDAALVNAGRIVGAFKDALKVNPNEPPPTSETERLLANFLDTVNGADVGPGPSKGKPPK